MTFTLTRLQRATQKTIEGSEEYLLNMGPQHPSTHGVLRLVLRCDGEIVRHADLVFGYLHRCDEKLNETHPYYQVVPYTDRWDYLASMVNNHVTCLAMEDLGEIEIPRRAEYIRVLVSELQRIASHLFWFGTFGLDIGATTMLFYCTREREKIVDIFEELSGARLTYHYIRIGGVMADTTTKAMRMIRAFCEEFPTRMQQYSDLFSGNEIFLARARNTAYLSPEEAINLSQSGVMLRASGVAYDVRKNKPYSIYPELDFAMAVSDRGDILGRYEVRWEEMKQSLKMVEQCYEWLENDRIAWEASHSKYEPPVVMGKIPKTFKPKRGETYACIEAPRGELGVYLVADGGKNPYKMHIKSSCQINLQSVNPMCQGLPIADVVAALGSVDIVLGEVDK